MSYDICLKDRRYSGGHLDFVHRHKAGGEMVFGNSPMIMRSVSVKDIMTTDIVSVHPETPLIEAVEKITQKNINGLPVIDKDEKVVGILTDYDLTIKGSLLHLPTFLKLLQALEVYKKDKGLIREDMRKIFAMKVSDVMNSDPLLLKSNAGIEEVGRAFAEHHRVNPIPIVDDQEKLIGIVSRYDLVKLFGAPSVDLSLGGSDRKLDANINNFLEDFERQFVLVSKFRTHYWLFISLAFAVIGFLVAFAWLARISF